jgi:hypothetical protein
MAIAEPGADFEDHVISLELKHVGHHRDNERLRDCLIKTNRQRSV